MSIEKVKTLLSKLQVELKDTSDLIDEETKQQLAQLDLNINQILDADSVEDQDIYDGIMQLEYGFLTKHPVASNIMREAIEILSKAGI